MTNKEYIKYSMTDSKIKTLYQKDALDNLLTVSNHIDNISKVIQSLADDIVFVNDRAVNDFKRYKKAIDKLKMSVQYLQKIVLFAPHTEPETVEEFEKMLDYPISLNQDDDGYYFVKFDFDLPVMKNPFSSNERANIRKTMWKLPQINRFENLFLYFEFHQGKGKTTADRKEINNRDVKLITDILIAKYSNNGDNGTHYTEFRRCVLDGNYYTNIYLIEQKDTLKFLEKHPL